MRAKLIASCLALIAAPAIAYAPGAAVGPVAGGGKNTLVLASASADIVSPILSLATGQATGITTASGTVLTDEGNGVLDCLISVNATEPEATIEATTLNQQTLATAGVKTCNFTGLLEATTYYIHYFQRDAAGNPSNVIRSLQFTTQSSGTGTANISIPSMTTVLSRTSCVAPCAIYADGAGVTSPLTTRPFHELDYEWNFGDPDTTPAGACTAGAPVARETGEGYWACGAPNNTTMKSKNSAFGPQAMHVYETPGDYTITLTVGQGDTDGDGGQDLNEFRRSTQVITVTDPNTVFASTTACIANGALPVAGSNGCPSGATGLYNNGDADVALATALGTNGCGTGVPCKRVLWRRGDTFSVSAGLNVNTAGPGIIGSYGSGAKPIFSATNTHGFDISAFSRRADEIADWRFVDIAFNGNDFDAAAFEAGGPADRLLFLRTDVSNVKFGWTLTSSVLDFINEDSIALLQTRGSAGNLTLNGEAASGGTVTLAKPAHISITNRTQNFSGINFTVTGTAVGGAPLVETLAGNNGTLFEREFVATTGVFATVTSVATNTALLGSGGSPGVMVGAVVAPLWDEVAIVESTIKGLVPTPANGGNGVYVCARRLAIVGNHVDTDQGSEHGMRTCSSYKAVYAHNTIEDIASGRAFLSIRSAPAETTDTDTDFTFPSATTDVYVSDNHLFGGNTTGMMGVGTTNPSGSGIVNDVIFERNFLAGAATTTGPLELTGNRLTARNNVLIMPAGGALVSSTVSDGRPSQWDIRVFHNTLFRQATNCGGAFMAQSQNGSGDMTGTVYTFHNNIAFCPNESDGTADLASEVTGSVIVDTFNTTDGDVEVSPLFNTIPPTTPSHVCLASAASYAANTGTAVPVWRDYFGAFRIGARDMGSCQF